MWYVVFTLIELTVIIDVKVCYIHVYGHVVQNNRRSTWYPVFR